MILYFYIISLLFSIGFSDLDRSPLSFLLPFYIVHTADMFPFWFVGFAGFCCVHTRAYAHARTTCLPLGFSVAVAVLYRVLYFLVAVYHPCRRLLRCSSRTARSLRCALRRTARRRAPRASLFCRRAVACCCALPRRACAPPRATQTLSRTCLIGLRFLPFRLLHPFCTACCTGFIAAAFAHILRTPRTTRTGSYLLHTYGDFSTCCFLPPPPHATTCTHAVPYHYLLPHQCTTVPGFTFWVLPALPAMHTTPACLPA